MKRMRPTYPFGNEVRISLYAPSGAKLATFHQLVCLFSFGPLLVATANFTNSCPVLVAWTSGVAAIWPMMLILAKEALVAVVLNARTDGVKETRRRANILNVVQLILVLFLSREMGGRIEC